MRKLLQIDVPPTIDFLSVSVAAVLSRKELQTGEKVLADEGLHGKDHKTTSLSTISIYLLYYKKMKNQPQKNDKMSTRKKNGRKKCKMRILCSFLTILCLPIVG